MGPLGSMGQSRRSTANPVVVVALGGNAILQPGQVGTFEEQLVNVDDSARRIVDLIIAGFKIVLVHGNGPQIGNLLIQQELATDAVGAMPMDVCGAMSQGQLGYMLCQCLENHLFRENVNCGVASLVTETIVNEHDEAFVKPTKPVGPFYPENEARLLSVERGFIMSEDAGRGWRRVVPSPEPVEIVQRDTIERLVNEHFLVICAGGGGVPVLRKADGSFSGTAAVIDKDLAAARLALDLNADALLILTDVSAAYVAYGTPAQRTLRTLRVTEMEEYVTDGHFKDGSMGPKVEACLRMARAGHVGIIANLLDGTRAINGESGTCVLGDLSPLPGWWTFHDIAT